MAGNDLSRVRTTGNFRGTDVVLAAVIVSSEEQKGRRQGGRREFASARGKQIQWA